MKPFILQNGTWYHLDVHAPPSFIQTPEEIVYVSLHDSIILSCQVCAIIEMFYFDGHTVKYTSGSRHPHAGDCLVQG